MDKLELCSKLKARSIGNNDELYALLMSVKHCQPAGHLTIDDLARCYLRGAFLLLDQQDIGALASLKSIQHAYCASFLQDLPDDLNLTDQFLDSLEQVPFDSSINNIDYPLFWDQVIDSISLLYDALDKDQFTSIFLSCGGILHPTHPAFSQYIAIILFSECSGIPVICFHSQNQLHHDSFTDLIYPWQSSLWDHWVTESSLKQLFIDKMGINFTQVSVLPPVVNTMHFYPRSDDRRAEALQCILSLVNHPSVDVHSLPDQCAEIILTHGRVYSSKCQPIEPILGNALVFGHCSPMQQASDFERSILLVAALFSTPAFFTFMNTHRQLQLVLLVCFDAQSVDRDYLNSFISAYRTMAERLTKNQSDHLHLLMIPIHQTAKELFLPSLYSFCDLLINHHQGAAGDLSEVMAAAAAVPILSSKKSEIVSPLKSLNYLENDIQQTASKLYQMINSADLLREMTQYNRRRVVEHHRDIILRSIAYEFMDNRIRTLSMSNGNQVVVDQAFSQHELRTSRQHELFAVDERRAYYAGENLEALSSWKSALPVFYHFRRSLADFAHYLVNLYTTHLDAKIIWNAKRDFFAALDQLVERFVLDQRNHHLSLQELSGIVGVLFRHYFSPWRELTLDRYPLSHITDLRSSILMLATRNAGRLVIDHSDRLLAELLTDRPFAVFAGHYFEQELRIFGVNVFKERMGINLSQNLTEEMVKGCSLESIGQVSFFVRREILNDICYDQLLRWMQLFAPREIKLLWEHGFIRLVSDENLSRGIHLYQLGVSAQQELKSIVSRGGFVVASSNNSFMLNLIDASVFHFGQVKTEFQVEQSGLQFNDCYLAWIPPALRFIPNIETLHSFCQSLEGELYDQGVRTFGEKELLQALKCQAMQKERPLEEMLQTLLLTKTDRC